MPPVETVDRLHPVHVYMTPSQRQIIEHRARRTGMGPSQYLRSLGLGREIKPYAEINQVVIRLAQVAEELHHRPDLQRELAEIIGLISK